MEEEKTVGLVETFDTGELSTELIMISIILLQMNTFFAIMTIKPLIRERKRIKHLFRQKQVFQRREQHLH